jgi:tripartite-type tricarboxylate transporter receptor subunit TctC
MVVSPSVAANTLQEFIALAKSKPGQLNFGSPGIGNSLHLSAELFCARADVKMQHIPYKGARCRH